MGRKSLNDYPPEWPTVAQAVKDAAGWECIRCEKPHDVPTGYMLTVHHLDLDKSNLAWWNLVALCQRCHLRIQGKVIMERVWFLEHSPWFVPYVAGYYAAIYAVSIDLKVPKEYQASLNFFPKEWVIASSAELIAWGQGIERPLDQPEPAGQEWWRKLPPWPPIAEQARNGVHDAA